MRRAGQPLAAITAGCHRRLALRARRRWRWRCAPGRLRQPGRRLALMRSAPVVWALRARAPTYSMCSAPDNLCTCLLVVGMSMTSWNARCSRLSGQGVLRAPAEGEGGEGWDRHHDARACGGTLCAAAACAVRVSAARHWNGSAFPPGQAYPPHRERVCFDAVRCSGAHRCSSASSAELCDTQIMPLRAGSP